MAKRRGKKDAQLWWSNFVRAIWREAIGRKEASLLPPLVSSSSELERKLPDVLCGSQPEGNIRRHQLRDRLPSVEQIERCKRLTHAWRVQRDL